jgi:hypothetical protein
MENQEEDLTQYERLCVKNLPKYINNEKLKAHFLRFGQLTDVKVLLK